MQEDLTSRFSPLITQTALYTVDTFLENVAMAFIDTTQFVELSTSPWAQVILGSLSLSESAFFIIPPEVMMIPMSLTTPNMAIWLGIVTTITSVIGAAVGYVIGKKGGKPVLTRLFDQKKIDAVHVLFKKYDTTAIFISAFTPIPFKVFTIGAGVFDLDFKRFMVAATIGRGSRYMLIAGMIAIFGESIRYFLEHQFDKVVAVGTVLLLAAFAVYTFGIPFLERHAVASSFKARLQRFFK